MVTTSGKVHKTNAESYQISSWILPVVKSIRYKSVFDTLLRVIVACIQGFLEDDTAELNTVSHGVSLRSSNLGSLVAMMMMMIMMMMMLMSSA